MRKALKDSGWNLSEDLRAWARFKFPGVDIKREEEAFTDYWLGCGKPMADWDACFRTWIRRSAEFSGRNRNSRSVDSVEMPYVSGQRPSVGAPVLLRDHPLFKGVK